MAKNLSGDLQVASANRLTDGVVVFLDDAGQWVERLDLAALARNTSESAILLERAKTEAASVVDPFLVAVSEDEQGVIEPLSLREKIRAEGLGSQDPVTRCTSLDNTDLVRCLQPDRRVEIMTYVRG